MQRNPRIRLALAAATAAWIAATPAAGAGEGGFVSDRDRRLSIAAAGGIEHGGVIRLRGSCPPVARPCGWAFVRGRLVLAADPQLAIAFFDEPQAGRELRLYNCRQPQPRCQWTYEDGMFVSAMDRSLAISVEGNARHGARLVLRAGCTAANPDCTWSRQ